MLDINAKIQELCQERRSESIIVDMEGKPPKTKITIEIPGQSPIVFDEIEEFMIFHKLGDRTGAVGIADLMFLMRTHKELKEKINETLRNEIRKEFNL